MQDALSNLGLFKPGTDYYGRDYGGLEYHEHEVYGDFVDGTYEYLPPTNPGPYPSHAFEDPLEFNPFMGDFSEPLSEPEYLPYHNHQSASSSEELISSELSNAEDEYPSPVLDHLQFDPALVGTSSFFTSTATPYAYEVQPNYVSNELPSETSDFSSQPLSEMSSDVGSQPPTPDSEVSQSPPQSMVELRDLLPKNVSLAQKAQSQPLLPTDPQSAVAQLYASPEMWEKACHTKKGVFICTNCHHNGKPLSFRTMIELAVHFDSHGLMRKSKCEKPSCPWSVVGFSTRSEKNRHTKSQHSDLNYPCQTCGRRFGRCDSLKRHMKLVHDIIPTKKGVKKSAGARKTTSGVKNESKLEAVLAHNLVPSSPQSDPEPTESYGLSSSPDNSPALRWTSPQGYYSFITRT